MGGDRTGRTVIVMDTYGGNRGPDGLEGIGKRDIEAEKGRQKRERDETGHVWDETDWPVISHPRPLG